MGSFELSLLQGAGNVMAEIQNKGDGKLGCYLTHDHLDGRSRLDLRRFPRWPFI